MKITLSQESEAQIILASEKRNVFLEGNILKLLETENESFQEYLNKALELDTEVRKKRLDITKKFQDQNKSLQEKATENEQLMVEIREALEKAEHAKKTALNDLDVMQQKSQFELIGSIVQIALRVIVGVGIIVTGMYLFAMYSQSTETTLIGNTWSNLFGILLTNSFSIIGTIMGVKYATNDSGSKEKKDEQ